ncbi:MAG: hypothetical protein ACK4GT_10065 [Pararhodobacter sp.]
MQLTLSPIRGLPGQPETALSVDGEVLTCDGVAYDLSPVPEGGLAAPGGVHPFIGTLTRVDGMIQARLRVVLGDDAAPEQPSDPALWSMVVTRGPVSLPHIRLPHVGLSDVGLPDVRLPDVRLPVQAPQEQEPAA